MIEQAVLKITVTIERRDDGGLYVYSDDLPGFVLSHADARAVVADIEPALNVLLSEKYGREVSVKPIVGLREALLRDGFLNEVPSERVTRREYGIAA